MNKEYSEALSAIADGFKKLSICLWHTFSGCCIDMARFAIKHPIAVLLIASLIAYQFYTTATSRCERDYMAKKSYAQEVTIDSLEILLTK